MHDESTPSEKGREYEQLVKVGDAVATPDGEVWVVEGVEAGRFAVVAASRDEDSTLHVDPYEQTRTVLPRELIDKVADARKVRRS